MDHKFTPSLTDAAACQKCNRNVIMHTDMAECEACPNIGPVELFGDMVLCKVCIEKEMQAARDYQKPELQEQRLADYKLKQAEAIDAAVQFRNDIFNAETISINELKEVINSDESITNKHYALAEALTKRYEHFKNVIFELNNKAVEESNKQRAVLTYLNDLANRLRVEEREKLKLSDISYTPSTKPAKPKQISVKKNNREEIKFISQRDGIPEAVLTMLCMAKNLKPEEAAKVFKATTNAT